MKRYVLLLVGVAMSIAYGVLYYLGMKYPTADWIQFRWIESDVFWPVYLIVAVLCILVSLILIGKDRAVRKRKVNA